MELIQAKDDSTPVRAVILTQYSIFTVVSQYTSFPELNLIDVNLIDSPVYCKPKVNDMFIHLAIDADDSELEFLLRIVCETIIDDKKAFTFIVCKTKDEPKYDKEYEDYKINQYLKGNYSKWIWD